MNAEPRQAAHIWYLRQKRCYLDAITITIPPYHQITHICTCLPCSNPIFSRIMAYQNSPRNGKMKPPRTTASCIILPWELVFGGRPVHAATFSCRPAGVGKNEWCEDHISEVIQVRIRILAPENTFGSWELFNQFYPMFYFHYQVDWWCLRRNQWKIHAHQIGQVAMVSLWNFDKNSGRCPTACNPLWMEWHAGAQKSPFEHESAIMIYPYPISHINRKFRKIEWVMSP